MLRESLVRCNSLPPSQGCNAPLVVKIADSEREKNARRLQQAVANIGGVAAFNLGTLGAAAYYQQVNH